MVAEIKAEDFINQELFQQYNNLISQILLEKEQYKNQVDQFKKMLFGQKTEKRKPVNPEQLLFENIKTEDKTVVREIKTHKRHYKKVTSPPSRQKLPESLPRESVEITPEPVATNPERYERISEQVTEQLQMTPARFWVKRIVRGVYKEKETSEMTTGKLLPNLFPKFIVGHTVIAHVLTAKYADHLPLYRIKRQFGRSGLVFNESTMVGWIASASNKLELLYNRMQQKLPDTRFIHGDESPIPVLEKGNPKTHRGYMFVYVLDKKYVLYDYRYSRNRAGPLMFLEGFTGILLTDGYNGYNAAVDKYILIHIACLAHIRRKFVDAVDTGETVSEKALDFIRELYFIEETIKNKSSEERLKTRQEEAKPIYEAFFNWAIHTRKKVLPKSPTGKAIAYFLNEHERMKKYLEYPESDIDNNYCERTIRPMTIGRKNYLFAGSHEGAKRAAIIYSLILTCRIHNIDPYAYFVKVFEIMAKDETIELDNLLPDSIIM